MKLNINKITKRLIPSVSKFVVSSVTLNAHALLFGVVKKLRTFDIEHYNTIRKRNAYLRRNYSRLERYAKDLDYVKFERLSLLMIRSSKAYQIAMLCSASSDWYTWTPKKIIKTFWKISCLRDRTDLDYQRWWIDKLEKDYARPLGAPKLIWKVHMLKILQPLEILYRITGVYPRWQHAGTSNRGLASCWHVLLKEVLKHRYIYEFDLKGFFDNIKNQDSIPELPKINELLNKMVNMTPRKYNLPPEPFDIPVQKVINDKQLSDLKFHGYYDYKGPLNPDSQIAKINKELGISPMRGLELDLMDFAAFGGFDLDVLNFEEFDALVRKRGIDKANELLKPKSFEENYPKLMSEPYETRTGLTFATGYTEPTHEARAKGRDAWKGLGKKDHGFPQGANFSPFLSCLVLARAVKKLPGLLMYMDDGLIYADTKASLSARIRSFKKKISKIGLQLAEEKCRMVQEDGKFLGLKFLGIKAEESGEIRAFTRKGSRTLFNIPNTMLTKSEFERFISLLNSQSKELNYNIVMMKKVDDLGGSHESDFIVPDVNYDDLIRDYMIASSLEGTASERRVKRWIAEKALDPKKAMRWASDHGFLPKVLADIMAPLPNDELFNTMVRNQLNAYPDSPFAELLKRFMLEPKDERITRQLVGELEKARKCIKPGTVSGEIVRRKYAEGAKFPNIQTLSAESVLWLMKCLRRKGTRRKTRR